MNSSFFSGLVHDISSSAEDTEVVCLCVCKPHRPFLFTPDFSMAEPAELLIIKDQYELAYHCLSCGLMAEEAGDRAKALEYYKKGQQHLTHGVQVPTGGERHQGVAWDTARQLQQKMKNTLSTVNTHLSDLETSQLTTGGQRDRLLIGLPQPTHSPLHHLYPTIHPTVQDTTPTLPDRPASPALPPRRTLPAVAPMAQSGDQPPAYTPIPTDGHRSLAYGIVGGGLESGNPTGPRSKQDGIELLYVPTGVQMFFVAPNGQVSSLSNPGYLRIIAYDSENKVSAAGAPTAFLHVCDWLYPLTTDTPVLLANSGIYMFPDSLAETPGCFVGIVLSSELPAADQEMFQDLLSQLAELRIQGPGGAEPEVVNLSMKVPLGPPQDKKGLTVPTEKDKLLLPGWSEKMSHGILSGATKLSEGLAKGAEATGRAIQKGAAKLRDHMTPEDTPSEVSPKVNKSLQVAKQATGGAVRVSQFLVDGVSTVAGHVAEKVAPHVKKHGAKLIPESMKKSKEGQASNVDGAKLVAASGVQGFSTVWSSLEAGAKLVGKSVVDETVTTVKYKFRGLENLLKMSSNK
ncbi:spartin a isoform X2 [Echeneis naucrates]|uniref:spartin a isoform X2 n=1 Tax=Echeneis naucrates TaxID=173247 RepID=UPI001113F0ED|nr:spartin isoform X2 [Echeneis naucrates]